MVIALFVLFRFTDSDYPFGIAKLFLCHNAFETLKSALLSAHMLAYPDASKTFIFTYDGYNEAVGPVLVQTDDKGKEYADA